MADTITSTTDGFTATNGKGDRASIKVTNPQQNKNDASKSDITVDETRSWVNNNAPEKNRKWNVHATVQGTRTIWSMNQGDEAYIEIDCPADEGATPKMTISVNPDERKFKIDLTHEQQNDWIAHLNKAFNTHPK